MKKLSAALCAVLLMLGLVSCEMPKVSEILNKTEPSTAAPVPADTTVVIQADTQIEATYLSEANPNQSASQRTTLDLLEAGADKNGKRCVALIWTELPGGMGEIRSATLTVKAAATLDTDTSGTRPTLQAGIALQPWTVQEETWNSFENQFLFAESVPEIGSEAADDTENAAAEQRTIPLVTADLVGESYIFDVTEIVKLWQAQTCENNGFALGMPEGTQDAVAVLFSDNIEEQTPTLTLTYAPLPAEVKYGKFDFYAAPADEGNCFAYALRDTGQILTEDIFPSTARLREEYRREGLLGAMTEVKKASLDYVFAHREVLQISNIRELESFDGAIDPETEYRAALRIGIHAGGYTMSSSSRSVNLPQDFDFHWMVQLADGSWAQKFPTEAAALVPGSAPAWNPGLYPWNIRFGLDKLTHFYDSETVYFAITKDTDAITNATVRLPAPEESTEQDTAGTAP